MLKKLYNHEAWFDNEMVNSSISFTQHMTKTSSYINVHDKLEVKWPH